jgi:hypothetical protein
MIEKFPTFLKFSRLYWNETGSDLYGSIESALEQMIEDSLGLGDAGADFRKVFYGELMQLTGNPNYTKWVEENEEDIEAIKLVGGRFVGPEEIPLLLSILDREITARDRGTHH